RLARALPGIGVRGALRRGRGGGDDRPAAGVHAVRAVTARAALVLGSPPLGLDRAAAEREHVRDVDLRLPDRAPLPDRRGTLVPGGERSPLVAAELAQQLAQVG